MKTDYFVDAVGLEKLLIDYKDVFEMVEDYGQQLIQGILSNHIENLYMSDNTSTFGNSGGGLYNKKGELIGVPSLVYGYGFDFFSVPESGLGFSRDLSTIKEFLKGIL